MENETPESKPFDLKARLSRIGIIAAGCLVVLSIVCFFFWSWEGTISCFMGGLGILLAGWVTIAAVAGVANADSKTMRRKIGIRLVIRFVIFLAYFTILFTLPFLIFEPLVIGMSLLFPALVIDSFMEFSRT